MKIAKKYQKILSEIEEFGKTLTLKSSSQYFYNTYDLHREYSSWTSWNSFFKRKNNQRWILLDKIIEKCFSCTNQYNRYDLPEWLFKIEFTILSEIKSIINTYEKTTILLNYNNIKLLSSIDGKLINIFDNEEAIGGYFYLDKKDLQNVIDNCNNLKFDIQAYYHSYINSLGTKIKSSKEEKDFFSSLSSFSIKFQEFLQTQKYFNVNHTGFNSDKLQYFYCKANNLLNCRKLSEQTISYSGNQLIDSLDLLWDNGIKFKLGAYGEILIDNKSKQKLYLISQKTIKYKHLELEYFNDCSLMNIIQILEADEDVEEKATTNYVDSIDSLSNQHVPILKPSESYFTNPDIQKFDVWEGKTSNSWDNTVYFQVEQISGKSAQLKSFIDSNISKVPISFAENPEVWRLVKRRGGFTRCNVCSHGV